MGSYNWIEYRARCPKCTNTCVIRAQIHLASSYDGDATGRFYDRSYAPGDTMAWWPKEDSRFSSWSEGFERSNEFEASETCLANCTGCGVELVSTIRISEFQIGTNISTAIDED